MPYTRPHSPVQLTLARRFALVMLLLLLVIQGAGFLVANEALQRQAENQTKAKLQVSERIWQRLLEQRQQQLAEASAVLAADFGFRDAVSSADQETIISALDNSAARIGAGLVAMLRPDFSLWSVGQETPRGAEVEVALREVAQALSSSQRQGSVAVLQGQVYQFVLVPVRAPLLMGWVLMGFAIGQPQLDDYLALESVHVALLPQGAGGPAKALSSLSGGLEPLRHTLQAGADRLEVHGETYLLRSRTESTVSGQVQLVFMASLSAWLQPLQSLGLTLGLITVLGVVAFALGSYRVARYVTRPLRELIGAAAELEQGHFNIEIGHTRSDDEVGQLARGFDRMRVGLATQQQEIMRLAYWDRLTGLANRERFRMVLRDAIANLNGVPKPLVVITLNIDRFKHVNDVLGYAFGDDLLRAVAQRLQAQVQREDDLVARLGGDEFAILLTRTDAQGGVKLAERITQAFAHPLSLQDQTVDLSASMGLACWPEDGDNADTVMSRSEIAMHAAKARTAGVLRYAPALDSSSAQNLSLLTDLRRALEQGELRLYLQPKLSTSSGAIVAAEALVRWQHPQRGLVPPMEFIPFAEQTGFVRQLTLWIFEAAARQWQALQPPQGHLRIAINLSTRDLLDLEFPNRLGLLMQRHAVGTEAFCLEITESAIMDDPQRANATLMRLSEMGFKLSIDDFGTGYSSLAYLKSLPVNELKIDKSFVMNMVQDQNDEKIVRSTIDLAHNLGLSVVAEGVEDAEILQRLRALRCDEAQGYFISKPMPSDAFVTWRAGWYAEHPPANLPT